MEVQADEAGVSQMPRLLTVQEVAAILAVPVSTVHHWERRSAVVQGGQTPPV